MIFGPPGEPLEVQGPIYMDLGCHYGGLGAPFLDKDRVLDHNFSIHALGVVPGCSFNGFMVGQGAYMKNNTNSLYCRSKSRIYYRT